MCHFNLSAKNWWLLVVLVSCCASGCTSFRTTSLFRLENDSVQPQQTNRKLKGIPVKLKIPSHLMVTIFEEQVILRNSQEVTDKLTNEVKQTAANVAAKRRELSSLLTAVEIAQEEINFYEASVKLVSEEIRQANDPDLKSALDKQRNSLSTLLANTRNKHLLAKQKLDTEAPATRVQINKALDELSVAEQRAAGGYTLISFSPPQLHVETDLQYTDKVFLVDFKRPAGGILDLKGASMDDEQYFSEVKAEVTERTMADISQALKTIETGVVPKLRNPRATPVSARTPDAEGNVNINFQKSVIATKRFDISEPGWEIRMQDFVNQYLGNQYLGQAPSCGPSQTGPEINEGFGAFVRAL